jgi:hypothetical protein
LFLSIAVKLGAAERELVEPVLEDVEPVVARSAPLFEPPVSGRPVVVVG